MGYERNDGRFGRDRSYDRDRTYDRDPRGQRDYGRQPQGYDYDDRGFFDRAGDEVRSWFGDEDAERRRRMDDRYDNRGEYGRGDNNRGDYNRGDYGRSSYGSSDGNRNRDDQQRDRSYGGNYGSWGGGAAYGGYSGGGDAALGGGGYSPSDYGAGRGAGATSNWGLGAGNDRADWGSDPNYRSWRDRQMADLDRDYQEYHQENRQKFHNEFSNWRQNRQTQRDSLQKVQEHQEVVGSDGQHIGTVDKVRGDRIILTKQDKDAGGHHHSIPSSWIGEVSDKVTISKTADQAKQHWRDEERNSGSSWNSDNASSSDRNLNRSFSGTY